MFVIFPPGGSQILLNFGGRDATLEFDEIGHSSTARAIMSKFVIGTLVAQQIRGNFIQSLPVNGWSLCWYCHLLSCICFFSFSSINLTLFSMLSPWSNQLQKMLHACWFCMGHKRDERKGVQKCLPRYSKTARMVPNFQLDMRLWWKRWKIMTQKIWAKKLMLCWWPRPTLTVLLLIIVVVVCSIVWLDGWIVGWLDSWVVSIISCPMVILFAQLLNIHLIYISRSTSRECSVLLSMDWRGSSWFSCRWILLFQGIQSDHHRPNEASCQASILTSRFIPTQYMTNSLHHSFIGQIYRVWLWKQPVWGELQQGSTYSWQTNERNGSKTLF